MMNETQIAKEGKEEQQKNKIVLEQQGGVKLGQGGFGCVITPAVSCKRRPLPKNAVSKITYVLPGYESDYEDELSMLNRIKKLDPQQKYFVSVNDECLLDTRTIQNRVPKDVVEVSYEDDELESFRVKPSEPKYISRMSNKDITKKYCLVDDYLEPRNQVLEFGGYSLYHITPDKFPELYNSIQSNYRSIIRNLLTGLQLLHSNRIAHRDIKEDNILGIIIHTYRNARTATQKLNKSATKHKTLINRAQHAKPITKSKSRQKISHPLVRYIDFGLSNNINPQVDEGSIRNFHWSGTDGYIPIDFVLLHYMEEYALTYGTGVLRNQVNKQRILEKTQARYEKAYKVFYDDIHIEQSLIKISRRHSQKNKYANQQKVSGYEFLDMLAIGRIYDKLVNSLINNTFYKIMKSDYIGLVYKSDIFALGITLAFMRRHYRLHRDKHLTDLISRMIKLNPVDRPSIKDCMSHSFVKS